MTTLSPGEITFSVLARAETNEPGRRTHASIGIGPWPCRSGHVRAAISPRHRRLRHDRRAAAWEYAEDLAATMLASTLGIEFDPNAAWNERKKLQRSTRQLIIDTLSVSVGAQGH